ncbi:cytosine/adenosine deaminase-related metal-dependent hydrolase [Catenuloplanes nepalensis]|uniref:Cytosine/adenosine deaminase-related metal-dependent hydrolase n=1 Tax=Catenuloplanes nepalensis TaxID=587533 RepID=A0ABT9MPA4_9ACTN|nr:amidohydrolase family protein [Catenuloplanes nepalensis]MDP9793268.1 cytosine/adenosine deaminase-related metal-dependent hydrolase [Catenuloplanes nepalensis]
MTTENPTAIVFRRGIVLTMEPGRPELHDTDVLVENGRITAVGTGLAAPRSALEIDAAGGILMPGMIDTHRHMWQTAQRGYGSDWSLTNYFYFYYINHVHAFRPEDVYAGNLLAALESMNAGVTTTVDWSHGLRTTDYADAAVDALTRVPGRFVLAYGNYAQGPWEWSATREFRDFVDRRITGEDLLSFQIAFDMSADPAFPEKAVFDVARELDVRITTHAGVWGGSDDAGLRRMADHGVLSDRITYVHTGSLSDDSYQRIAATGGNVSVATESESAAGQGYSPTRRLRRHGITTSLSTDSSVLVSGDMFHAMRATLGADRALGHIEAHAAGETVTDNELRAADVLRYATLGGAEAIGLADRIGSIAVGKRADLVLIKNDRNPAMFPIIHPAGHVVQQANAGDVHTVLVDGRLVKKDGVLLLDTRLAEARRAVRDSVDRLRDGMDEAAWNAGLTPSRPDIALIDNPYHYGNHAG